MRNKINKSSITKGVAKYCEQLKGTMKGKKWKDIRELMEGMIKKKVVW